MLSQGRDGDAGSGAMPTDFSAMVDAAFGSLGATEQPVIASLLDCFASRPLLEACEQGDVNTVQQLLPRVGVRSRGATHALRGAVSHGQAAVVRYLLEEGVTASPSASLSTNDPSLQPETLDVPLLVQAAQAGSPETVRLLQEHGLSLMEMGHVATLERGRGPRAMRASLLTTPLGAAAWALQPEVVDVLADIASASSKGQPGVLDARADVRALNARIDEQQTSRRGGSHSVHAVRGTQEWNWAQGATPLLLAVYAAGRSTGDGDGDSKVERIAKKLLQNRADPCAANLQGDNALHVTARFGFAMTLNTLLQGRADPSLRNDLGDLPMTLALRTGRTQCVDKLKHVVSNKEMLPPNLTELEQEEAEELARLKRLEEKRKQKKNRQRERLRAQKQDDKTEDSLESRGADKVCKLAKPDDEVELDSVEAARTNTVGSSGAKVQGPSSDASVVLGCEALRAKIAQAQREKTRIARQLKLALRRCEDDRSRAERCEELLEGMQQQVSDLKGEVEKTNPLVDEADTKQLYWKSVALAAGKERDDEQAMMQAETEQHAVLLARLQGQIEAISQNGLDDIADGRSFEAERERRVLAEEHCLQLERALSLSHTALLPTLSAADLPALEAVNGTLPAPENLEIHRQLHMEQKRHMTELRDLTATVSAQLQERDLEVERELSKLLSAQGLTRIIEVLEQGGLVLRASARRIADDPKRTARLRRALLGCGR